MLAVLVSTAAMILIGVGWRMVLGEVSAEAMRSHLTKSVYHLFLPALVLHVLWQSPVDLNTIRVPLVAALSVLLSLLAAWLLYKSKTLAGLPWARSFLPNDRHTMVGALILASAFGNFSYLGLPVLSQTFGDWAQVIAIQFDLLASTPILFSVGILVAHYYGSADENSHPLLTLLQVPAIWAAIAGLVLSATAVAMPIWLKTTLTTLGAAVVPLMLLSVGMALRWQSGWSTRIPMLLPVLTIQLIFMPMIAWGTAIIVGMPAQYLAPTIIEAAMPTMVLGLVICDRFKLDVGLYAESVTLTTIASMITLPLWLQLLS